MFREAAQALVEKMGAVDAVAASLAHISGTKEIKSRSLLTGREVVITWSRIIHVMEEVNGVESGRILLCFLGT